MNIKMLSFLLVFPCFVSCQQDSSMASSMPEITTFKAITASLPEEEVAAKPASDILSFGFLAGTSCQKEDGTSAVNIIFKSSDGGLTWQDVSAGLPQHLQIECVFANGKDVFLGSEEGLYYGSTAATAPNWQKDFSLDESIWEIFPSRTGSYARTEKHGFVQQMLGTGLWLPVFANLKDKMPETMLETLDGTMLIGTRDGILKSNDQGKTWKQVHQDGWVMNIVESDGVLLCTNQHGILRSTDGGEHWDSVISEGGVGIAVERIEGGFAAITYNTQSKTRRVRISMDAGKTWQAIDAGLPPHANIASIKQVGEYFFCGHPDGIFRSDDRGKTWEIVLPSIKEKVFNLSVLGKVIYTVPRNGGC